MERKIKEKIFIVYISKKCLSRKDFFIVFSSSLLTHLSKCLIFHHFKSVSRYWWAVLWWGLVTNIKYLSALFKMLSFIYTLLFQWFNLHINHLSIHLFVNLKINIFIHLIMYLFTHFCICFLPNSSYQFMHLPIHFSFIYFHLPIYSLCTNNSQYAPACVCWK